MTKKSFTILHDDLGRPRIVRYPAFISSKTIEEMVDSGIEAMLESTRRLATEIAVKNNYGKSLVSEMFCFYYPDPSDIPLISIGPNTWRDACLRPVKFWVQIIEIEPSKDNMGYIPIKMENYMNDK